MTTFGERLVAVRARIAAAAQRAGRDPGSVELLAVTKGHSTAVVEAALAAGVRAVGESRAQELLAKDAALREAGVASPEWEFVGRIQRNKVKALAPVVRRWHSVDRPEVGDAIAAHAPGARVFAQVNVAGEEQKGGCLVAGTATLVEHLRSAGLAVEGLMTVPPLGDDPRPWFRVLAALAADVGVDGLSMGMSGDFEVAVEEGATVVRVGEVLTGPRSQEPNLRR
ncbi:MAG TPA: YggS family pyridoxal phosphate-dependent enzyme [Acidimicrobiia bacterium]|jgi:PLP dependent protein|nr:YggS family pyridoxal phosphate-dependent enzyme [Acidimicrobiia bacterium]